MIQQVEINNKELWKKIKHKGINFGRNFSLKIYGTLYCRSGKRMKKQNRVFFRSEKEAIEMGFRPCGNCMRNEYKTFKNGFI